MKYGNTWWGQQWLNSLTHIDYSNRLPRGRSYANKGAVKSIDIDKNKIHANVQGTRSTPYRIDIEIPEFTGKQKKEFTEAIRKKPLLLARLLNRELPPQLDEIAKKQNIKLFPSSWKDFSMECSCPDWAVPCKHLASVIYIIANEIDRNPFIIFELHGLDLLSTLATSNGTEVNESMQIPAFSDFVKKKVIDHPTTKEQTVNMERFDFSKITDLGDNILELLQKKPLFHSRDFHALLKKFYNWISKDTAKYVKTELVSFEFDAPVDFEQFTNTEIILNDQIIYFDAIFYIEKEDVKHFSRKTGFTKLLDALNKIPAKSVTRLAKPVLVIHLIYRLSLHLLERKAYIPQLMKLSGDQYTIRWIPALINEEVNQMFSQLTAITPPGLVQIMDTSYEPKFLDVKEQLVTLCSLFLNHFVDKTGAYKVNNRESTERLFFTNSVEKFNKLGEKEIPNTIYQWLSKLFITHKNYVPLIKVDEADEDNYYPLEILVENRQDALIAPIRLQSFLQNSKYKSHHMAVLKDLSLLAETFTEIERVIESEGNKSLEFNALEFSQILFKILPLVKLHGIRILLPESMKRIIRPKTTLALQQKSNAKTEKGFLSLDKIMDFNWQIALGDQVVSPDDFFKMVKNLSGIIRIKNQYILIEENELTKIKKALTDEPKLNQNELLRTALSEEYKGATIEISPKVRKTISELLEREEIALPEDLLATLRPYQLKGYEWMYRNAKLGFGCILADDMGLGKTVQVISLVLKLKEENRLKKQKALAIVPTTLMTNWQNEINKFAPSLQSVIYHGPNREFNFDDSDVVITTYGIVRSDIKQFQKKTWAVVIIDEAQNIKNPGTEQSKSVKKIKSKIRIAMSGTPVENRLSEYWSIFDFANKSYLGSLKWFKTNFASPIELNRDQNKLETFIKITSPFILRRLKTDKSIISDLPEKMESDHIAFLTKEQSTLYQSVIEALMPNIAAYEADKGTEKTKRLGIIFKLMIALKQICNHPYQYLKKGKTEIEQSGKMQLLFNLLENIYEMDEKVLIFTQFKEMGLILEKLINDHFNSKCLFLHGGTTPKKRNEMVEKFQNHRLYKTFILSIKAGGTGLNLTRASNVIHYDLWWNPAVENQATDRAYRIGQTKNVMVYRMITKGTFEEKINRMLQEKKELANLTVSTGEKWIGDLSNSELNELVSLEN